MDKPINKQVIDDIYRIGTPDAAVKLVPFLWDEDEDFAIYVAWHLGVLLKNPEVEEKLSNYPLKPEHTSIDALTYIWRPFETNSDSALFTITSRLAYLIKESSAINIPRPILYVDRRIIIPICSIEALEKIKNINLKKQMTSLDRTIKFASLDAHPDLKQNLLNRLLNYRTPTRNDWIKLYTKDINYNFEQSWHFGVVLGISIILSLIAVIELFIIVIREPTNNIIASAPSCLLIFSFWFIVSSVEKELRTQLFIFLGLLGILTFYEQIKRLWITESVWTEIHYLYFVTPSGIGLTIIGLWTIVIAGEGVWLLLIVLGTAGAGAAGGAMIGAGEVDWTSTPTWILMGVWVLAVIWVGGIGNTQAVVDTVVWALAGLGIGAWYRAKDKMDWTRYLAIFAFPFFCTFPIVFGYSSYAFYDWFGLTWQQITIIWIVILGVCTILWQWGQKLDYEARNPFKGILDSVKSDDDAFN